MQSYFLSLWEPWHDHPQWSSTVSNYKKAFHWLMYSLSFVWKKWGIFFFLLAWPPKNNYLFTNTVMLSEPSLSFTNCFKAKVNFIYLNIQGHSEETQNLVAYIKYFRKCQDVKMHILLFSVYFPLFCVHFHTTKLNLLQFMHTVITWYTENHQMSGAYPTWFMRLRGEKKISHYYLISCEVLTLCILY